MWQNVPVWYASAGNAINKRYYILLNVDAEEYNQCRKVCSSDIYVSLHYNTHVRISLQPKPQLGSYLLLY